MNSFFDFFDLEPTFALDNAVLKKVYLLKSRTYHPDYFTQATEIEKNNALEMTTRNNEAYKVLSDPMKRLEHILRLHGVLGEASEDKMDPAFLMEMMDINEKIMEMQMEGKTELVEQIRQEIQSKSEKMDTEAKSLKDAFDQSKEIEHLQSLKSYYFKKKYLARITEQLEGAQPDI